MQETIDRRFFEQRIERQQVKECLDLETIYLAEFTSCAIEMSEAFEQHRRARELVVHAVEVA